MKLKFWFIILCVVFVIGVIILTFLKKIPQSVVNFLIFIGIMFGIITGCIFGYRKLTEGGHFNP